MAVLSDVLDYLSLQNVVLFFVLAFVCGVLSLYVFLLVTTTREPDLRRSQQEKEFKDPKTGRTLPFPHLHDPPSVHLSIIVPSYKEGARLPTMMEETMGYLEERQKKEPSYTYEVIIVDDGSPDGGATSKAALKYVEEFGVDKVRLLKFDRNRGKGGAVRMGVLSARGERLLMVDADGATLFKDIERLEQEMDKLAPDWTQPAISIGSRSHLQDDAVANRSLLRNFLMYGFHFLVYFLCVKGINDTQCGFKLFTRAAARAIFPTLHVERWAFDVEVLYIAQQLKIPIAEVAVNWEEIEGTKMVPFWSWAQMGRDLVFIRMRYMFGLWKIQPSKKQD